MGYDEKTAARVRALLAARPGVSEKGMFGGLCFLIDGNMCCAVGKRTLMLRLGSAGSERASTEPHVRPVEMNGRTMRNFVYVDPPGYRTDAALAAWIGRSLDFATGLPPKGGAPKPRGRRANGGA